MVIIITTIPINTIKSKEQFKDNDDLFVLNTNVKSNDKDGIEFAIKKNYFYSYYYDKIPTVYIFSDREYYKTNLYKNVFLDSCYFSHSPKTPKDLLRTTEEDKEKYPRLLDRKFTDKDVDYTYNSLVKLKQKANKYAKIGEDWKEIPMKSVDFRGE